MTTMNHTVTSVLQNSDDLNEDDDDHSRVEEEQKMMRFQSFVEEKS